MMFQFNGMRGIVALLVVFPCHLFSNLELLIVFVLLKTSTLSLPFLYMSGFGWLSGRA